MRPLSYKVLGKRVDRPRMKSIIRNVINRAFNTDPFAEFVYAMRRLNPMKRIGEHYKLR